MEDFTIIDGVVVVVILLSALLAYSRGLVRESLSIAAWIGSASVAYLFAPQAEPLIRAAPVVGDFLDNCELSTIAAFIAVFALLLVIFSIFTPLFSSMIQRSALNGIDQALGFLFGAARGLLLVTVAFVLYDWIAGDEPAPMVRDSRSAVVFSSLQDRVAGEIDNQQQVVGWATERFESLVGKTCGPVAGEAT